MREVARRLGRLHPAQAVRQRMQRLDELQSRALAAMRRESRSRGERLLRIAAELDAASPASRLAALRQRTTQAARRLAPSLGHGLALARGRLQAALQTLHATSPLATLGRGYAIVTRAVDGVVLRDPAGVPAGTDIDARLARGTLRARVLDRGLSQPPERRASRWRVRRWRGVSLSRRSAKGLASLRRSTRTGVPLRRNASRKQFIR